MRRVALILCCAYVVAVAVSVSTAHGASSRHAITRHDRNVIRFFQNHPKLAATAAGGRALAHLLPHVVRQLQAVAEQTQWPEHHLLWLCIARQESGLNPANRDTGHNGHFGFLQMHPGWGYGTSYYASDDSQLVQEDAAESAYKDSGYSSGFLTQQWGQTISSCWGYTH